MPTTQPFDPYAQEADEIARRRRYAEMLREQANQPIQPTTSGRMTAPISWTQGLSKLAQGYMSGQASRKAEEDRKQLSERYRKDLADTLRRAGQAQSGIPGTPISEDASGNVSPAQSAIPGDPERAANIYMEHPATMPMGMAEIQRQAQIRALKGAIPQIGGGTPQSVSPQPGTPGPSRGVNPTDPGLLNLSMLPGGAGVAKLISDREIAGDKSAATWSKLEQSRYEFNNLSAAQKADLAHKGIGDAIAYAKAKDEGINLSGVPVPGSSSPQPSSTPSNFPRESPQDRLKAAEGQRRVLELELSQERAKPPSAERDLNIAALNREMSRLPGARGVQLSPKQQREAASAGAETAAREQAKLDVERPQVKKQIDLQVVELDRLSKAAKEIIDSKLSRVTGPMGFVPSWPGGNAAQVESLISSLKAQVSGMKLQAMREASKTGGAVGQVTEKEWPRLENMIVALDPVKQGPKLFRQKLGELQGEIEKVKGAFSEAYRGQYGESYSRSGQRPTNVPQDLWDVMTAEEKAAFR